LSNFKDILATSSLAIEGYRIEKSIEFISSHSINSLQLLDDYGSGFIETITSQVIEKLKAKAKRLKANGILGIKIGIQELINKENPSFILTISGTAVKLSKIDDEKAQLDNCKLNSKTQSKVTNEEINIPQIDKSSEKASDKNWEKILSNQIDFCSKKILEIVDSYLGKNPRWINRIPNTDIIKKAKTYFDNLHPDYIKKTLYSGLINYPNSRKFIIEIIKRLYILDQENVFFLLDYNDRDVRYSALQILAYHIKFYSKHKANNLKQTIEKVRTSFPELSPILSDNMINNGKNYWLCNFCNKINNEKSIYCENSKCKRGRRGFSQDEINPESVIATLEHEIKVISSILNLNSGEEK